MSTQYDGHNLVFIVGCPRSGTTWLQRILSCHPQIHTGQESDIFDVHIGPQLRQFRMTADPDFRGGLGMACYLTEEQFLGVLRSFMMTLLQPMIGNLQSGELFLEKTPSHALYLPEIVEMLPKSRIIHILRDPRDVVASILAAAQGWGSVWAENDAQAAATTWVNHVASARRAGATLPGWQYTEMRYEDLHSEPQKVMEQCRDFLGLPWDADDMQKAIDDNQPDKARACKGGTPIPLSGQVAQQSGTQVKEPEGFVRKAKVGSWEDDLTFQDKLWVWRIARHEMEKVGYTWPAQYSHLESFAKVKAKLRQTRAAS